jgi:hypothetical protein
MAEEALQVRELVVPALVHAVHLLELLVAHVPNPHLSRFWIEGEAERVPQPERPKLLARAVTPHERVVVRDHVVLGDARRERARDGMAHDAALHVDVDAEDAGEEVAADGLVIVAVERVADTEIQEAVGTEPDAPAVVISGVVARLLDEHGLGRRARGEVGPREVEAHEPDARRKLPHVRVVRVDVARLGAASPEARVERKPDGAVLHLDLADALVEVEQ